MKEILQKAKKTKNDEFYTCYEDIEKELCYYLDNFKDKIIYCPTDSIESNFIKYLKYNFSKFGIRKLIATSIKNTYYEYDGINEVYDNTDNGDFRSETCKKYFESCDIIITNPPFSLFREFFAQIQEYNKKFLLVCNQNALMYKEIFPLIMRNEVWLGVNNGDMSFRVPLDSEPRETRYWVDETGQPWRSIGNACWLTNLDFEKRHKELHLENSNCDFNKYDTYDAINVDKVKDIPKDYMGKMGVPITFLHKYCPEQFIILGELKHGSDNAFDFAKPIVKGKELFTRVLIQRRNYEK